MRGTAAETAAFADITRRYAVLSFLQWLPVGLTMVPLVLLLLERGFTLAEVAVVVGATYSVTVAVLELPTGGLADLVGRRPVLVGSALAHAVGLVLLGLATSLALVAVSAGLRGLARALSTGPLEAWYVDTVQAVRPIDGGDQSHLTTGLARGEIAASGALAAGTLAGGALPLLGHGLALPFPGLAIPVLLAGVVEVLRLILLLRLPDVPRRRGTAMAVLRTVPGTVASGLRLAGRDRIVLRLLLVGATAGVALAVLELVTPAWLDVLVGDRSALLYAVLVTVGFGADALGAMLAPVARRRLGTPARASAATTAVALAAVAGLAGASLLDGATALVAAGVAYVGVFIGLGAAGPPLGELLHGQVTSEQRATMLSVQSLMFQVAGASGAVLAGALTTRYGPYVGFVVAAISLGVATVLLLRMQVSTGGRHPDAARSAVMQ